MCQCDLARDECAEDWDVPHSRNAVHLSPNPRAGKGRSKERGLTIVFQCRAQCPVEPAKELARLSQVISQLAHQSANGGGHKSGTDTMAHHIADEDPCAGIREF